MADIFDQAPATPATPGPDIFDHAEGSTQPPSRLQKVAGNVVGAMYNLGETSKGAIKGALQTGSNAMDIATLGIKPAIENRIKVSNGKEPPKSLRDTIKGKLAPLNDLQKGGETAEQIGEMFVPIPGISELKAPAAASPFLKSLYGAGREALDVGMKTAVQTEDPKQAAKSAAIGAAFGAVPPLARNSAVALRSQAEKTYAQVLSPGTKADKFITKNKLLTDKGKDLLDRGVMGLTERSLKGKIEEQVEFHNQRLDAAWKQLGPNAQHSIVPILDDIQKHAIEHATAPVSSGQKATPWLPGNRRIVDNKLYMKYRQAMGDLVENLGPQIDQASAYSLRKVRQILDERVRSTFAGAPIASDDKAVVRATTDAIRRTISGQNPTIGAINKELSFWLSAQDVFENTSLRKVGQKGALLKMAKAAGSVAGAAAGLHHGSLEGAAMDSIVGGLAGKKLEEVFSSTAWKTVSAVNKNRIAKMLATGDVNGAAALAAQATAGMVNRYHDTPPPARSQQPPGDQSSAVPPSAVPPGAPD